MPRVCRGWRSGRRGAVSIPQGLAIDTAGKLYIGDAGNYRIRMVSPDGNISTVAGNGTAGYSGDGGPAANAQLDGGPATEARLDPYNMAVDGSGNIYIADPYNRVIRKVTADGVISTIAGGGPPENYPGTACRAERHPAASGWLPGVR
jgi:hypothetical protein